jgi:hypothetical protein
MLTSTIFATIAAIIVPLLIAAIGAGLMSFLKSPVVEAFIKVHTIKLAADAANAVAQTANTNNQTLGFLVRAAMAYAEQHKAEILLNYKSKADYVVAKVSTDPRFAPLGAPLSAIENMIEDCFEMFYSDYGKEHDHES